MNRGNTKIPDSARTRNYCFTLNNYKDTDIAILQAVKGQYVFQEETGQEGTKHLQGVLMFDSAKTFSSVKKLIPKAHIEKCKDLAASIAYCSKDETRTGLVYKSAQLHSKKADKKKSARLTKEEILAQARDEILADRKMYPVDDFDLPYKDLGCINPKNAISQDDIDHIEELNKQYDEEKHEKMKPIDMTYFKKDY